MLKVSVLETGSSGNSTILDNGKTIIAIDLGLKSKKLWDELAAKRGYSMSDVFGALITHAHGDHIKEGCVNGFIKTRGIENLFTTPGVAGDISRKKMSSKFELYSSGTLEINKRTMIGTFGIMPIRMEHYGLGGSSITECVGFDIFDEVNNKRYIYASDTKTLQHVVVPEEGFDLLMLEDNHCELWTREQYELGVFDDLRYTRTKDHLSTQKLAAWIFENNIKDAPVIRLHESPSNKRPGTIKLTNKEFYGEFFK